MDRLRLRKLRKCRRRQASRALKSLVRREGFTESSESLAPLRAGLRSINSKHLSKSEQKTLEFLRVVTAWLDGELDGELD